MDFSTLEQQYGLPAGILSRMLQTESGGRQFAVSPKGAEGYFQFLPSTAKEYGVNPYNLESAAQGAARYLSDLYKQTGSWEKAVAAYNWGPGNLATKGLQNAPNETRNYVKKVLGDTMPDSSTLDAAGLAALIGGNAPKPSAQQANTPQHSEKGSLSPDELADLIGRYPTKTAVSTGQTQASSPSARSLVDQIPNEFATSRPSAPRTVTPQRNWLQIALSRAAAIPEAALSVGSGLVAAPIGALAGLGYGLTHGYGTPQGAAAAERKALQVSNALTYTPQSPEGRALVAQTGNVLDRSGLIALAPDMGMIGRAAEAARVSAAPVDAFVSRGANIAGRAAPVVKAPLQAATRAGSYLFNPEASAGARAARSMAAELREKVPAPLPEPRPPLQLPAQEPNFASTIGINEQLNTLLNKRFAELDTARKAAGEKIEQVLKSAPKGILDPESPLARDVSRLRDELVNEAQKATASSAPTYGNIINSLDRVLETSPAPYDTLVELRRQLSDKANFSDPSSGYAAIGEQRAADIARRINDILDKHLPEYKAARGQYKEALDDLAPARTRFLKSIGADETTGTDLTKKIMESPRNVDRAIEAAGSVAPIDRAIAQRIQIDLAGKSAAQINSYLAEHQPILEKLPQAAKTADNLVSRASAAEALKAIQKQSELRFKNEQNAYLKSHELAAKYYAQFAKLDKLPPKQLPNALRSTLESMYNDGLISPSNYSSALDQVKLMEKSINRQSAVQKIVGATTAISFLQYAIHRKMWDVIMKAVP